VFVCVILLARFDLMEIVSVAAKYYEVYAREN
jgi:hypothetical protein